MAGGDIKNLLINVQDSLYKRQRRSPLNILLNAVIIIFFLIFVFELMFNVFYMGIYVIDRSMTPTIIGASSAGSSDGEFVYVDKYAKPGYGDIVVVYRENNKDNIIKRVVAFGGDTVELKNGVLYVNSEKIDETYLDPDYNSPDADVNTFGEYYVEEGYMFLLGDNRNVSNDSRQNGAYPVEDLIGVVPEWSMSTKSITTKFYTFFNFTVWGK